MNFKTTIALLLLLVIAGGYALFIYIRHPDYMRSTGQGGYAEKAGTLLLASDTIPYDQVTRIVLRRGNNTVELAREGKDWMQTAPARFPLNDWSLEAVVTGIANLRYTQQFTPGQNDAPPLDKLDLATPAATVQLFTRDASKPAATLKLGKRSLAGRAYVMVNDDPRVYVVSDGTHRDLVDKGINDWRRNNLRPPGPGQIDRLTLAVHGKAAEIEKIDGVWRFTGEHVGRAGTAAVQAVMAAVEAIHIERFVTDKPSNMTLYGLDHPQVMLTVRIPPPVPTTQPQPGSDPLSSAPTPGVRTLRIGAPVDLSNERYFATWSMDAAASPLVFEIVQRDLDALNKTVDDLRDRQLFLSKAEDAKQIAISLKNAATLDVQRTGEGWTFAEPGPGYGADYDAVNEFVRALTAATASSFLPAFKPSDPATGTIKLWTVGKPEPETLTLYPHTPDADGKARVIVVRGDEGVGCVVAAEALKLEMKPLDLRQRTVLDLRADTLTRVRITRPHLPPQVFTRDPSPQPEGPSTQPRETSAAPGQWAMENSPRFETAALEALIKELTPLRAKAWRAGTVKLGDNIVRISVQTRDGTSATVLLDLDHAIARLDGTTDVFEVGDALVSAAQAELRDRTILSLDRSDVARVTVEWPGKPAMTVKRDADERYIAEDGRTLNQAAAGALFDVVTGLRAERFVKAAATPPTTLMVTVESRDGGRWRLTFPAIKDQPLTAILTRDLPTAGALPSDQKMAVEISQAVYDKLAADLVQPALPVTGD